jgi:hypothetical protein
MSGMNPGFAAYLARKKANKTAPSNVPSVAPNTNLVPKTPVVAPVASSFAKVAKRHSKVKVAPQNLKHGKYL